MGQIPHFLHAIMESVCRPFPQYSVFSFVAVTSNSHENASMIYLPGCLKFLKKLNLDSTEDTISFCADNFLSFLKILARSQNFKHVTSPMQQWWEQTPCLKGRLKTQLQIAWTRWRLAGKFFLFFFFFDKHRENFAISFQW